jgi:hypothetical protein
MWFGFHSLLVHTEWSHWQQPTTRTFFDLVNHGALLSCTDPRDHVYAFLGHPLAKTKVDGRGQPLLVPDYGKDFMDLYLDVSVMFLQEIGLRLLSSVEHTETTIEEPFPSWVVRWNVSQVMNDMPQYNYRVVPIHKTLETHFCLNGKELGLRGITIDWIEDVYRMEQLTNQGDITFVDIKSSEVFSVDSMMDKRRSAPIGPYESRHCYNFLKAISGGDLEYYLDGRAEWRYKQTFTKFRQMVTALCCRRCFAVTKQGYFALVPWISQPGDVIGVVLGAKVPFLLRPKTKDRKYKLLGEAYVQGIMQGELDSKFESEELEFRDIILE